jgi:hypothetical protein
MVKLASAGTMLEFVPPPETQPTSERARAFAQDLLELAQADGDVDGGGERVDTFVVEADMRRPVANAYTHGERAATGVPDRPPGRLRDDRAGGAVIKTTEPGQPLCAETPTGLLVGDDHQADTGRGRRQRSPAHAPRLGWQHMCGT